MKKTCNQCHETKPYSEFHKNPRLKDGHKGDCARCCNERNVKWRQAHPESVIESRRAWNEQNYDAFRASVRAQQVRVAAESGKSAINKSARWTYDELETVMRTDLSLLEISKLLGRTYASVASRRSIIRDRQGSV